MDVGDKDNKFVGSKQWIGSMEVSYVLDHLIGVSKTICLFIYTFVYQINVTIKGPSSIRFFHWFHFKFVFCEKSNLTHLCNFCEIIRQTIKLFNVW